MSYIYPTFVDLRGRPGATALTIGYRLAGTAGGLAVTQAWAAAFVEASSIPGLYLPIGVGVAIPDGFIGTIFYGAAPSSTGSAALLVDVVLEQIGPGTYENASKLLAASGPTDLTAGLTPDAVAAVAAAVLASPVVIRPGGISTASFAPGTEVPIPSTPPPGYSGTSLSAQAIQDVCSAAIAATEAKLPTNPPANYGIGDPKVLASALSDIGINLGPAGLDAVVIEAGINARQALSPILAAAAGQVSGAGTGIIHIKGGNSDKTRITAVTDNAGNRSSITLSLP